MKKMAYFSKQVSAVFRSEAFPDSFSMSASRTDNSQVAADESLSDISLKFPESSMFRLSSSPRLNASSLLAKVWLKLDDEG